MKNVREFLVSPLRNTNNPYPAHGRGDRLRFVPMLPGRMPRLIAPHPGVRRFPAPGGTFRSTPNSHLIPGRQSGGKVLLRRSAHVFA